MLKGEGKYTDVYSCYSRIEMPKNGLLVIYYVGINMLSHETLFISN